MPTYIHDEHVGIRLLDILHDVGAFELAIVVTVDARVCPLRLTPEPIQML